VLAAVILVGCNSVPSWIPLIGGEKDPTPPTELTPIANAVTANTLWSARLTKGSEGRRLLLVPAVHGDRVYVADSRGLVVAAAANSGRMLWERETKLPLSAGPELAGDRLILGTSNGLVIALSATDGKEQWRAQVSGEVLSVPRRTADGKIIVHTLDDTILGLDETKGTELWRVNYPAPILTLRGSSTPAITPNGVIVGLAGGKLVKLDPTDGTPLWEVIITQPGGRSELARITDIDVEPVVVGKVVYVGTYNGDLAAVELDGGNVLWRRELSSHAGLTATESDLFITDSEDLVWGADPADGAGRWKQEQLRHRQLTAPALTGKQIAVADLEGWLHLLNQTDGRLLGRTRITKAPIISRPLVVAGGRLYVYATDGTLSALSTGSTPGVARPGSNPAATREVKTGPSPTQDSAPTAAPKPKTAPASKSPKPVAKPARN
jgi:outer membrane protein assembly factor BamB